MTSRDVTIERALSSQEDLQKRGEHCSADPQTLGAIGSAAGHQVRVMRSAGECALYTVTEVREDAPEDIVRMGVVGRRRLHTEEGFDAVLDSRVTDWTLGEEEAEAASEFIERLDDDGQTTGLIAIAPHGGAIKLHTDQ